LVNKIRSLQNPLSVYRKLKIIDSTTISLSLEKYGWAKFRKTKAGVKIHLRRVFADDQVVYPEKITITSEMDALIDAPLGRFGACEKVSLKSYK
jgi:hypothetical protein